MQRVLFAASLSDNHRELLKDDSLFIRKAVEVGGNLTARLAVNLYCCTLPRPVFAPYAGRVKNTEGNSEKGQSHEDVQQTHAGAYVFVAHNR